MFICFSMRGSGGVDHSFHDHFAPQHPPRHGRRLAQFGEASSRDLRLAAKHDAVNLGQGFPDFDGPDFVKEAALLASGTVTTSTPMVGVPALREAVAAGSSKDRLTVDPDQWVTVTCGCRKPSRRPSWADESRRRSDHPRPFYDSYPACLAMTDAVPVPRSDARLPARRRCPAVHGQRTDEIHPRQHAAQPLRQGLLGRGARLIAAIAIEHDLW